MDHPEPEERPRPYRSLPEDQVEGAQAAFLMALPGFGEDVEYGPGRGRWCVGVNSAGTYVPTSS